MTLARIALALALGAAVSTAAGSARAQEDRTTPHEDGYCCFPFHDDLLDLPELSRGCFEPRYRRPQPRAIVRLRVTFVPELLATVERDVGIR